MASFLIDSMVEHDSEGTLDLAESVGIILMELEAEPSMEEALVMGPSGVEGVLAMAQDSEEAWVLVEVWEVEWDSVEEWEEAGGLVEAWEVVE